MMSPVPCALTASRLSVTKAGGLNDVPVAKRSTGGEVRNAVTHV